MSAARDDLLGAFEEQRALIADYCEQFDSGKLHYSRPLATSLRVLLHDTKASHALLEQMDIRTRVSWLDSALPMPPGNLAPDWGLVMLRGTVDEKGAMVPSWKPLLDDGPPMRPRRVQFTTWWKTPVAKDSLGGTWSRSDLVLAVANKDGGAHVDTKLPVAYEALSRRNAFAGAVGANGVITPAPDPVPACIRQIAYEALASLSGWPR